MPERHFSPLENPMGEIERTKKLSMYELPNSSPLTPEDLNRYQQGKTEVSKAVGENVRHNLYNRGHVIESAQLILLAPPEERTELIKQCLHDNSWYVKVTGAQMIEHAPEGSREELRNQLVEIIQKGLSDKNWEIKACAAQMIEHAPEGSREELRTTVSEMIKVGLRDDSSFSEKIPAAKMITHSLERDFPDFIATALQYRGFDFGFEVENLIDRVPEEKQSDLRQILLKVAQGLWDDGNRKRAIELVPFIPMEARAEFVKTALKTNSWNIRQEAVLVFDHIPTDEQPSLRELVGEIIRSGLESDDWKKVRRLIDYAPREDREELWNLYYARNVNYHYIEPKVLANRTPLYDKVPNHFVKRNFEKHDLSRTTLLGESPGIPNSNLKGRVIIRHVNPMVYAQWTKAYESYSFWEQKGFSYVPVEPIIRARPGKVDFDLEISVFTRVLGPNVLTWRNNSPLFQEEIYNQMELIKEGLREMGIIHGDAFERNFCLVFEKDNNGETDLTKPPKVYIIDFEKSLPAY